MVRVLLLLWITHASSVLAQATEVCAHRTVELRDAVSSFRLGVDCDAQGEEQLALEAFTRAHQLDPSSPEFAKALARTDLRLNHLTDALRVLAEVVPLESKSVTASLLRDAPDPRAPSDPGPAIHFFQRQRDRAHARKDARAETRALLGLAHAFESVGKGSASETYYQTAQRLAHEAKRPELEAYVLLDSAGFYQDRDNYDQALANYVRSAEYFHKATDHERTARSLIGIGEVHQLIGDLDQGDQWFNDALAEARDVGDRNLELRVLAMRASVASDREDVGGMTARMDEALNNLRSLLQDWSIGKGSTVAFPITSDGVVAIQMIGEVETWMGHVESAIACANLALAMHRLASRAQSDALGDISLDLYHLGFAHTQAGHLEKAWAALEEARRVDEQLDDPDDYYLFNQMGAVSEKQEQLEQALKFYAHAADILDRIGHKQRAGGVQVSVRGQAVSFYLDAVSALLKLQATQPTKDYTSEAFLYLERGRAQTLLGLLNDAGHRRSERLEDIERALSERGPSGREKHEDLSAALSEEEMALRAVQANSPAIAERHFTSPPIASVADIQGLLDDRTAMLEYALGERVSGEPVAILWAVTREGSGVYKLHPADRIDALVERYRKNLEDQLPDANDAQSQRWLGEKLYRVLIEPATKEIRGKDRLIIVPAGSLYYLPFETLIRRPSAESYHTQRLTSSIGYIGTTHAVSYAPSASVLLFLDKRQGTDEARRGAPQLPLLAFGDPVYESGRQAATVAPHVGTTPRKMVREFPPLPHSAEEVKMIAAALGVESNSDTINLRERATKARLKEMALSRYRILHFATHAVVGDQVTQFAQPTLVLSNVNPAEPEDEYLRMSEIFDLHLNADLVVLSACKTGEGKLYRGEGLVGLTSAFLHAGSRSVVASLWLVHDQSTSLFMEAFYKNLAAGKTKAEALRLARKEIMERKLWSDTLGRQQSMAAPYYWAPFILIGGPN